MRINTILLFLVFSFVIFFSFLIFKLNQIDILLDLFFDEIQVKLGKVILVSFLSGSCITFILELLYMFGKDRSNN